LNGVSRTYGSRKVLHPLDLSLKAGECAALLGHNGSGKSTLLRIAAGRDTPTTGTVTFDGLPSALSSGQLQSLLLASALVRPRDLLLLDEPEQRLDPGARRRLAEVIGAETAEGVGVLLVTHDAELARAAADRVLVLREGEIVADGTPEDVLADGYDIGGEAG
jgi:ABC-type multidrug transport system ATPase subunit